MLNINRPDWMEDADCADVPMHLFFPGPGKQDTPETKQAMRICAGCQVREQCLAYAMSFPDRSLPGIWGGTTERERSRMHHSATPIRYRVG